MSDLGPQAFGSVEPTAAPPFEPAREGRWAERSVTERAGLFDWLAGLFAAAPSSAAVALLRRGEGSALLDELADDRRFASGVAMLRAALAEGDDAAVTRRLGIAFGRLFLGIGGPATVAPYESAVTCGGRLFQAPTGEMERLLAAHDLSVADRVEPADHLAIEVALLARLIGEVHPDRRGLVERLAHWVPIFGDLVFDRDDTGFYAGAARLLVLAIECERDTLDVIETD